MTIMELREKIRERHGLGFGYERCGGSWRGTRSRARRRRATRRSRTEDVESAREDWFQGQLDLDPLKLVFIDESVPQRHGGGSLMN